MTVVPIPVLSALYRDFDFDMGFGTGKYADSDTGSIIVQVSQ